MFFEKSIDYGIEYSRPAHGEIMVTTGQQNRLTVGIFSQQRQGSAHIPDFPAAANCQHGDAHIPIFRMSGQIQGVGKKRTDS